MTTHRPSDSLIGLSNDPETRHNLKTVALTGLAAVATVVSLNFISDSIQDMRSHEGLLERVPEENAECVPFASNHHMGNIDRADAFTDGASRIRGMGRQASQVERAGQEPYACYFPSDGANHIVAGSNVPIDMIVTASEFDHYTVED